MDLPIGILPGSVPDDPSVPAGRGDLAGRKPAAGQVTGRQLALQAAQDLRDMVRRIGEVVDLLRSPVKDFITAGTVGGGGTVEGAPVQVLNGKPNRRGLFIANLDPDRSLTIGLGISAPALGTGLTLLPGQSWDGRISGAIWVGSVTLVGDPAGTLFSWLEG